MRPSIRAFVLIGAISLFGIALAANQQDVNKPETAQSRQPRLWSAAGGTMSVRWNHELAHDLGIGIAAIEPLSGASRRDGDRFDLARGAALQFRVKDGYFNNFSGGMLQARGGYLLTVPGGKIALNDFRLVPRTTVNRLNSAPGFDLVGADGMRWFYVDTLMHELTEGDSMFTVRSSELRIGAQLAQRLRQPAVAGWVIGEVQLMAPIERKGSGAMALADTIRWHGDPAPDGTTYQADLFMQNITVQYTRCQNCTGENGSGRVVATPSSKLRNNVNEGSFSATIPGDPLGTSRAKWTASIPWHSKFSGNFAPYNNDQHPYLIWNMYRVNGDGSLEQIGRSGVKHAFLTVNGGCLDANDHNSHVLGRGCDDTYTNSTNDSNRSLGPRSEILAGTGQWGRCGSVFDPQCTGVGNNGGTDPYFQRLIVGESQIAPTLNIGASWLFESWYLNRDDIDIYNSMATLQVNPSWTGSVWNFPYSGYRLGTAIDRWMGPPPPRNRRQDRMIRELATDGGHAKVGVKVSRLANGQWRYHYAVMNLDFAFAQTQGAEPNLRVVSNRGFDGFGISTPLAAGVTGPVFRDGDLNSGNDWQFTQAGNLVKWTNGASPETSLGWGVLYSFSLTSSAPPTVGQATLYANDAPTPRSYTIATLVPLQ